MSYFLNNTAVSATSVAEVFGFAGWMVAACVGMLGAIESFAALSPTEKASGANKRNIGCVLRGLKLQAK
jgi:hypothetical protein